VVPVNGGVVGSTTGDPELAAEGVGVWDEVGLGSPDAEADGVNVSPEIDGLASGVAQPVTITSSTRRMSARPG